MALFFACAYYHSHDTILVALFLLAAASFVATIVLPKAEIVTDQNGIGRYFGRKLHVYYEWGDIQRVETTTTMAGDYVTVLRGAKKPLPVGPMFERNHDLIKSIHAHATNASFDDLTMSISSRGYPRRSPIPLLAVIGALLLLFWLLMTVLK